MIEIKSLNGHHVLHRMDADSLTHADLAGVNLSCSDLSNQDLTGADLSGAELTGARLDSASLEGANLEACWLAGANLAHARLAGARLAGAYLYEAFLHGTDLTDADLTGANLTYANLGEAILEGAVLTDSLHNRHTRWPVGLDAEARGARVQVPEVFPEYRVRLERVRPGEQAISEEDPANLGKRTKLGGEPYWVQHDETPTCGQCQQPMSLLAQIDSIDYTGWGSGGPYMFGDVGIIYLFLCAECGETAVVEQCY